MPEADERTQKLSGMAITISWLLSLAFIGMLCLLNYANVVSMSVSYALGLSSVFMIITGVGLNLLFRLRSDI